jgi:hypothetical protein
MMPNCLTRVAELAWTVGRSEALLSSERFAFRATVSWGGAAEYFCTIELPASLRSNLIPDCRSGLLDSAFGFVGIHPV